jgi:hypothetical protein
MACSTDPSKKVRNRWRTAERRAVSRATVGWKT